jgi:copper(I)-binding protein
MTMSNYPFLAAVLLAASFTVQAQTAAPVKVEGAWARAVLQGQVSSGAYMTLTAREPLTLTGASSPAAAIVEIHQMKLEGDVMKMRAIDQLALPAGRPVELKPGGYHIMLMDLRSAFKPDTQLPLTLQFRNAQGQAQSLQVSVPVRLGPATHGHKP